ncbi:hypothetical protein D3C71_234540 [compost metagenome]
MEFMKFVLESPWRVIGLCAILTFTTWNLSQVAKFRLVEKNTVTHNFGTKEDK